VCAHPVSGPAKFRRSRSFLEIPHFPLDPYAASGLTLFEEVPSEHAL
jgi:hypothetical protein